MIKTLVRSIKQEKEKFRIPHSVQDAIPVKRIWTDGIFQTGNAYSRSYRLTDINYAIASKADKTAMLLGYSELLNALDSGASAKITINNRRVDRRQFEQELLIRPQADKLNGYRQEYNDMLCSHAASNNNVVQERYLTINAHKRSVDEARAYFQRMGGEVTARLGQLSSQAEELDASARLQILRDFFKAGQPAVVPFNMEQRAKRGHDFKDWFCPDSLEFYADFFKSDVRWGRVLYLQDYASFIKDDFIMELCELDRSMMVSIDILPVPTDEAVRELQNKLLGVETNVANWQRRQNNANNYTANVPYDMQLQRKETTEFLNDLTERDQRMMYGLVTVVHLAGTKEQLDADIDRAYGEGKNPLVDKVKLILSIFEPLTENGLTAKQRSLLDRCAERVYRGYIRGGYRGTPPTLVDLRRVLLEQPEAEAHDLALASELYTTGSLNIFAHQTNVNTDARILCYDIRELDEQLRPVGMVVTLDAIFNRVIRNWRQGKRTWILADEFYILFRYSFSAEFFYRLFKRMRKYNAFITAISQNVDEILRSDTARLMLANSELLVMLNQAATDREELAKLLNISENQLSYITNVPAGHGLIRCGGAIIPFENSFPKNTKLYQLMTTKPNEKFE